MTALWLSAGAPRVRPAPFRANQTLFFLFSPPSLPTSRYAKYTATPTAFIFFRQRRNRDSITTRSRRKTRASRWNSAYKPTSLQTAWGPARRPSILLIAQSLLPVLFDAVRSQYIFDPVPTHNRLLLRVCFLSPNCTAMPLPLPGTFNSTVFLF